MSSLAHSTLPGSNSLGSTPGWGDTIRCVLGQDILPSKCLQSLCTNVQMGTGKSNVGGEG